MKINKKISIFYFSATGNSLKVAMDIASQYSDYKLISINSNVNTKNSNSELVGFIFPVYMGTLPNIVKSFLLEYNFMNNIYYFAIGTYYTYKGCALSVVNGILKEKGFTLEYGAYVPTVGNCLMEYQVSREKRPAILARAEETTKNVINQIVNEEKQTITKYCKFSETIHMRLFNFFFKNAYQKFSLENSCNGCGTCVKVCPVSNISRHNNIQKWGNKCIACHACVHWCPKNSITLGRSKGRLQYQNPSVSIRTIIKTNLKVKDNV